MTTRLYFVHALSPLHAGTGQGSGVIDLPIAREKATGIPYLPGSSLKGVLRDRCGDDPLTVPLFGPRTENASDHAGSLQLADARLLLLPVRSLRGTFAYLTSPYVLRRLARDAADTGQGALPPIPAVADAQCDITPSSELRVRYRRPAGDVTRVVIEDLDLEPREQQAEAWANWLKSRAFPKGDTTWPAMIAARLCIVSDDVLNFLLTTALEVIARNRLDPDSKTVAKGALWYEEALPAESVLYGLATITPTPRVRELHKDNTALVEKLNALAAGGMQLGGKATVGRGLCRLRLFGEG